MKASRSLLVSSLMLLAAAAPTSVFAAQLTTGPSIDSPGDQRIQIGYLPGRDGIFAKAYVYSAADISKVTVTYGGTVLTEGKYTGNGVKYVYFNSAAKTTGNNAAPVGTIAFYYNGSSGTPPSSYKVVMNVVDSDKQSGSGSFGITFYR